jgi:ferredoxin
MNRIYFFTGTGNSLWAAREIAQKLTDCDIVAIRRNMDMAVPAGLERLGFVFPTYGWASPLMVADFFRNANFPKQGDTYVFAVATCGGLALNAVPQTNVLLAEKGVRLHYGANLKMYKNSVLNYNMGQNAEKVTEQSAKRATPIVGDIVNKREKRIPDVNRFLFRLHLAFMKDIHETDYGYQVSGDCVSCGLCAKVCPAQNITLQNGKPEFHHRCERCLACIQHCPKRAIDYKDKTQKRGRYAHPQIAPDDIAGYYESSLRGSAFMGGK